MKKIILPLFSLLLFASIWTAGAQNKADVPNFTVKVDTIWIDANDYVTATCRFEMQRSAKCRDFYFCCFRQTELNTTNVGRKTHLLGISLDGKTLKKVPMPSDFDGDSYFDLFARNDTLYIKPYWEYEQIHYRFNYDKWKWEPTDHISDVIYEDADYQVAYKDFGEWGAYTWFIDKHSQNQYLFQSYSTRIVPCQGIYYCLKHGLHQWKDPTKGLLCVDSLKHNFVKDVGDILQILNPAGKDSYTSGNEKSIGMADPVYLIQGREDDSEIYGWSDRIYDTVFSNMISLDGQLYFWTVTNKEKTFISTIEDGKLIKITDIPGNYNFFSWSHPHRGRNIAPNQFLMQFKVDPWTYGLVDMVDTTISIHYLIHNQDTLQFSGKDNVKPLVEFLLANMDNLALSTVDSMERLLGGTPSTLLKNVYEEERYDSKRQPDEDYMKIRYFKLVDTSLVVETCYYFDRKDSIVDEFRITLHKPNYYIAKALQLWRTISFKSALYEDLKAYFTHIVGKEPVRNERFAAWEWTFEGHTLSLQDGSVCFENE